MCTTSTRGRREALVPSPGPAMTAETASAGPPDPGEAAEDTAEEPPGSSPEPTPEDFPGLDPGVWRKHIYTGAMGATHWSVLTGMFLWAYVRELGLSYRSLGVFVGLASYALAFKLVGAHVTSRIGRRRTFWFYAAMFERLFRGVAILAAFYLVGTSVYLATVAFVLFMTLSSVSTALAVPPWFSWLSDLIPAAQHGRMMGRRSVWTALTVVCVMLPSAAFIDLAGAEGFAVPAMLAVFVVGLALGYVDLFIHRTIPEPYIRPEPGRRLWAAVAGVLRDRGFRPVLVFKAAWGFSMSIGGSLSILYLNEYLGFRHDLFLGVLALVAGPQIAIMLAGRYVGGLIDRLGCRRVLVLSHLVWSFVPIGMMLMRPGEHVAIIVAAFFLVANFASAAAMNATQKLDTRLPRREDRAMYLAVSACVGSLAVGTGAFVAGDMLERLSGWSWQAAGTTFVGFHVLFVISATLRLAATALTRFLPDRETEHATMEASENRRAA